MNSAFLPYFFSKGNNFLGLFVYFPVPRSLFQMMVFRTGEWAFGANLENIIHRHVSFFFPFFFF